MIDYLLGLMATPYGKLLASSIDSTWTTRSGYYLVSADGVVQIWIANRAYALRVQTKGDWPNKPCGNEYSPCWADRKLIWRAVKRLRLPSIREFEMRAAWEALSSERKP